MSVLTFLGCCSCCVEADDLIGDSHESKMSEEEKKCSPNLTQDPICRNPEVARPEAEWIVLFTFTQQVEGAIITFSIYL